MGEFAVSIDGMLLMPYFQWFPVESSSTGHLLSQFTKTIKMALKSTDEERAILRARSAAQRFPVVEWRQRVEHFHSRSIMTSRGISGNSAWRPSDGHTPLVPLSGMEVEDWNTEVAPDMNHPAWDTPSICSSPFIASSPGSPGQWSQDTLMAQGQSDYLTTPQMRQRGDDHDGFLAQANQQIARDHRHVTDLLFETKPEYSRPFGPYSRASPLKSIESIVDGKTDSPLNEAVAAVSNEHFSCLRT
jgi:alpha-1,3-glucan synthase